MKMWLVAFGVATTLSGFAFGAGRWVETQYGVGRERVVEAQKERERPIAAPLDSSKTTLANRDSTVLGQGLWYELAQVGKADDEQIVVLRAESLPFPKDTVPFTAASTIPTGRIVNAVCFRQRPMGPAQPMIQALSTTLDAGRLRIDVPALDEGDSLLIYVSVVLPASASVDLNKLLHIEVQS